MKYLLRLLTWWNGQTLGTQLHTWRKGIRVGEDAQGNLFYRNAKGDRRWVIFNGEIEASRIDPDWHGWLHHTWDQTPTERPLTRKAWQKPHAENATGSAAAYAPSGSLRQAVPAERRDYQAWQPE